MAEQEKPLSLSEMLEAHRRERELLIWEGTFREYFELLTANPHIAALSHARICDMILAGGTEKIEGARDEMMRYNFFSTELFGIEEPISKIVEYFKSAAQRLEVRKRILLLMGPVGGGKSTIVTMLKRGLENWTRDGNGAGLCDQRTARCTKSRCTSSRSSCAPRSKGMYGIYIEGELCPQCRYNLEHVYHGRHEDVLVQRIVFSEKDRVGIGTFAPSDPKSQDITELTGSIDLSTIGEVGVESDPRAYRFDGELNIANRGMMEFIEMLKVRREVSLLSC